MDYLVLGKNIYIKNHNNRFFCYDYSKKILGEFIIAIKDNAIEFDFNNDNLEAINLMSEILYFMGNKKKNIIFINNNLDLNSIKFRQKNNIYIKEISEFELEREKKFNTIDELYKYPHLVPWNLVKREEDIAVIINKYVSKDKKILEIGSGYGKNLDLIKNTYGYKNIVGIEYSKNAYELSKKIVSNNILGDITKTNFEDQAFDVIVDIGCLHCVSTENKRSAINEVLRIMKQNGIIISRYFLNKDDEWIKKYPIKINKFGNTYEEIIEMFSDFELIESYVENECVYIVGRKK